MRPDPLFERDGYNVLCEVPLTFMQAALGDEVVVPTIDGKVKYAVPEGTQPGTVFRLRNKGIPYVNGRGRGDQYVTGLLYTCLAQFTGCATVSATRPPRHVTVRRIELIPLGAHVVMIVVLAANGVIKNKAYRLDMICAPEILDFFNKFANDRFADRSIDEISTGYLNSVAVALGEYSHVFPPLLACLLYTSRCV